MTISRRRKQKLRVLQSLFGKATLSQNRGRFLYQKYPRPNRKDRRHSGRKYPKIFGPQRILDEEGIFVDYFWNNWLDYRDGFRDWSRIGKYWYGEDDWYFKNLKKDFKKQYKIRRARKRKLYKYGFLR